MKISPPCLLRGTVYILMTVLGAYPAQAGEYLDTLAIFHGRNGAHPLNIIQATTGDFYGVTYDGGKYGQGTLFRIPPYEPLETMVDFDGRNGARPCSRLIQGPDGAIYGTTCQGGPDGKGIVFALSADGKFRILAAFTGRNGAWPEGDLVTLPDGSIYGCTWAGGAGDLGTAFVIPPGAPLKTLVAFTGPNGSGPLGLTSDKQGTIYGLTRHGGALGQGTIFTLSSGRAFRTLAPLPFPENVQLGAHLSEVKGTLYGTTANGGPDHRGTIFSITPDGVVHNTAWFEGVSGTHPNPDLVRWRSGYFYMERLYDNEWVKSPHMQWRGLDFCGTASTGGEQNNGTIFVVSTDGAITTLASFTGAEGSELGSNPNSLVAGVDGNLYGTTSGGGHDNMGTVFRLQLQLWIPPGQDASHPTGLFPAPLPIVSR